MTFGIELMIASALIGPPFDEVSAARAWIKAPVAATAAK